MMMAINSYYLDDWRNGRVTLFLSGTTKRKWRYQILMLRESQSNSIH